VSETQVIGKEAVVGMLAAKGTAIRDRIVKAQKANGIDLAGYVVGEKLSGQVLNVRTNRLRGSIHDTLTENANEVTTAVGTNVVYARAHEFGCHDTVMVKEHLRRVATSFADTRTALAYDYQTRRASTFGSRKQASSYGLAEVTVRAHPMTMNIPEKSFLRSSLREQRDVMLDRLRAAMSEGARS